ncbi:hypothetical protein Pfo_008346 [Paulownia fortunei]|nr:hypothetical protein Pfo_008346 [Paulownia fortunei]
MKLLGLSITGLQLPKANFSHDDQVKCNNCKTSIFDIHRSCLNCLYKLCVTCCREIRDGFPWGNGQYRVHGVDCNFTTKDGSFGAASCSMDYAKWKLTDKGTIVCPAEGMGGCGHGNLELKSTYRDNWVSELLRKAESVAEEGNLTDALEAFEGACSCKEASRDESKVSYFHCPTVVGVEEPNQKHFHRHLYKGEPVIVPDVLSGTTGLSWEPLVMWRACRKSKRTSHLRILDFSVMNCLNWCEETINMHQFFKGYVEGLFDGEGWLKILKLEDWPPAESFQEQLPRHLLEFVRCLPFRHYTHPHAGYLNMSAKIPEMSLKPDLGPKMCFGYGVGEELGFGSVTNLQYALSDRVNILMHTAAVCLNPERLSTIEKLRRAHFAQDPVVFSISNEKANKEVVKNQQCEKENENKGKERFDPSISGNRVQRFEDPEGGAVWDIFRREDVPKLEEYLRKHSGVFRHIFPLQQLVHPVHEKAFYLTVEHKRNLKEEYGIEPWTFVQRLGDAVFVPAGCPHQIRNMKSCTSVAVNFVSPESVGECIRLSTEYRRLPHNHSCKEDKLQVKKMTLHAMSQAVQYLDTISLNTSRHPITPPVVRVDVQQNPAQPGENPDLAFMRQEMEVMKLRLEKEGHILQLDVREHLEKSIQDFLNRIGSTEGSSLSN